MEQRRKKENELNKRMNRWASIGWWEADFTDRTVTCSESLSEKLGLLDKGCQMSFDEWAEMVHPDHRERVAREFNVLRERDSYDVEYLLRMHDGEYVWGHSRCALREVHTDGRIVVFGTWQKIDAPKSEEMKEARTRINSLLYHQLSVTDTLAHFVKTGDINQSINEVLKDVLQYFKASRVYLVKLNNDSRTIRTIYEQTAEGETPFSELSSIYKDIHPWWINTIVSGNNVVIDSFDNMPPEADGMQERFAASGVKSNLAVPIAPGDGTVRGFIGVDMSEKHRRWAGEDIQWLTSLGNIIHLFIALDRSREEADNERKLLANLLNNMPVGLEIYDKNHICIEANKKCLELFDAEHADSFVGLNLLDEPNLTPELKQRILTEPLVDVHLNYDLAKASEYYGHKKSGVINLVIKYCHIYDRHGNFNGHVVIYYDITDQLNIQLRLKEFNNIFSLIADYSKVGYVKVNILSGDRYAIDQWYHNLGIDPTSKPRNILDSYVNVNHDDREQILDFIEDAVNGKAQRFSKVLRIRDINVLGGWRYLQCNIVVSQYAPEKQVVELISINYDITEMKNMELELKAAKEKAENSEKLKSVFLSNMSHEIRTPLNLIVGFSEVLATGDTNPEMRKQCEEIIKSNNELLQQLFADILDLAKIEAGTMDFKYSKMSANELCRKVAVSLRMKVKEGVMTLFDEVAPDCMFESDHNRLSQVLFNFATNAVKFTSEGHIKIGWERRGSYLLRFYVEDTGIGIAEENIGQVFDRFVKLNDEVKGTGLGLKISKEIIKHLGGRIGVDSQLGKGSTFWFDIPIKE